MATTAPPKQGLQRAQGVRDQSAGQSPGLKRSDAKLARNNAQVGAVLRTNTKGEKTSDEDTKEEREQVLDDAKPKIVDELANAAVTKLTGDLNKKVDKVLSTKKKLILEQAKSEVEKQIKTSAQAKAGDIKADTLMTESNAWDEAVKHSAEQNKAKVEGHRADLVKSANDAFVVTPTTSLKKADRPKHLATVKVNAKKLMDEEVTSIAAELTDEVADVKNQEAYAKTATTKATDTAKATVQGEVDDREAADKQVKDAVQAPVEEADKEIHAKTLTYLEKGLGAHGTGWFRSTQFKAFHTKMKAAAREKGHDETEAALGRNTKGQGVGDAEYAYKSAQAQVLTHNAAKMELREIMAEFAKDLLKQADDKYKVKDNLEPKATAAAWAALRDDPANKSNQTAAGKAAAAAVKAEKPKVLDAFHDKAQALKNAYVKAGGDTPDPALQNTKNNEVITTKVNPGFDKVDKDNKKFGDRVVKKAMDAPNASKGLQLIGGLIDIAAPQRGDSCELEVELKIPATHGAFCYFTVKGSAERSDKMELGIEINFGAGWETWGLSARGGFIVFLKGAAQDTVTAMQVIHYGAFRNLTHVSDNAANFWAGVVDSKKTASKHDKEIGKTEQAELWAAMIEERAFANKDHYVEVGGGIGGSASLKAGVEGEASGELTTARRWNKEVLDEVDKDSNHVHGLGKMGDRAGKDRDKRKELAVKKRELVKEKVQRVNKFTFGASLGLEANGQKFEISMEASKTWGAEKGWEIEISGAIPYDPSQTGSNTQFSKIAATYVPGALSLVKKAYDAYKAKHPDAGDEEHGSAGARIGGAVVGAGEDGLMALDAGGLTNNLMASLASANPQNIAPEHADGVNDTARLWLGNHMNMGKVMGEHGDMTKATSSVDPAQPFGMTSSLEVSLSLASEDGKPLKGTFKVSSAKELKMGGDLGAGVGLSAKLTKKSELGGVAIGGGEGVKPFMGGRG